MPSPRLKRRIDRQRKRVLLHVIDADPDWLRQLLAAGLVPADAIRWDVYVPSGDSFRKLTPDELTISAADRRFAAQLERMRHG